jgi:polysaccharide deacetylase 2 family uncharacterized protein YibQ
MRKFLISFILVSVLCGVAVAKQRQKQIFLVIDDAGLALGETRQFLNIPVPMTIAVLPHLKQTREVCAEISRHRGKEIILHQPMEAYNQEKNPGKGAIFNTTRPEEVSAILNWNLSSVRGAVGVNNHMGSRVTENRVLIAEVLRYCKRKGLFFLDSKTAYNSQVPHVAHLESMHMEERDVFLDIEHDREYVRKMWGSAVGHAKEHGYVIVIGHIWSKESAAAIRDSYETLQNQGYTFHKLSELYK